MKNHDKIVFLAKTKLNNIKVLISKVLIDSHINHDEFISVNKVLREYDEMKDVIKNPKDAVKCFVSVIKRKLQSKILVPEELNKIN